jgi:hypothetical protein
MVRMNITVPEDVVKDLRRIRNKSRYIAVALREKFKMEKKKEMDRILIKAYKAVAKEDAALAKEWDVTVGDGIE